MNVKLVESLAQIVVKIIRANNNLETFSKNAPKEI